MKNLRILVIGNDELSKKIKESLGPNHKITFSKDGDEGTKIFFSKTAGFFDLVIISQNIPENWGIMVARRIKLPDTSRDLKVILVTATKGGVINKVAESAGVTTIIREDQVTGINGVIKNFFDA